MALSTLASSIKLNPVLVAAFLVAVGQAVEAGEPVNWESLATIVVGLAVRHFVTPNATAEADAHDAFFEGLEAERANNLNGPV